MKRHVLYSLLTFCSTFCVTAFATDVPGDNTTTANLAFNAPTPGQFDSITDHDWYAVNVEAGHTYYFDFRAQYQGEGTFNDWSYYPSVQVRDGAGTELPSIPNNYNGMPAINVFEYTATATQTIYVDLSIEASGGEEGGSLFCATDFPCTYTLYASNLGQDSIGLDFANTSTLVAGTPTNGQLEYRGDADMYVMDMEPGTYYNVTITGQGPVPAPFLSAGIFTDSDVALINSPYRMPMFYAGQYAMGLGIASDPSEAGSKSFDWYNQVNYPEAHLYLQVFSNQDSEAVTGGLKYGGYTLTVNKLPDTDGDGLIDKYDQCPSVAGNPNAYPNPGCPDADGDGYDDASDACPTVYGASFWDKYGCTDSDDDGSSDEVDACPGEPGSSHIDVFGCADYDNDGISDVNDGDIDGDGIPNTVDADSFNSENTSEISLPLDGSYQGAIITEQKNQQ